MLESALVLGIDIGTSGIRIAIINKNNDLIHSDSEKYLLGFESCKEWKRAFKSLIMNIPNEIKKRLIACSIDGTSGTLIACNKNGISLGNAIPYYSSSENAKKLILKKFPNERNVLSVNSSIARACELISLYGENILLRHQADWISGWLLNNWEYGEEGNNIKLGWDISRNSWIPFLRKLSLEHQLPKVISSGKQFGLISKKIAEELYLPQKLKVIAGTTDSNAAVIATNAKGNEGITALGSTIVIKKFVQRPITGPGITNHLVDGKWIAGGASNTGGAILKRFFSDKCLQELSRQINPELDSGLNLVPLLTEGERFPINDPKLKPILKPRPTSDALYVHGLLEGLAQIEAKGWQKLASLGAENPTKIITIGGGAQNPQWRRIRERLIGIPVITSRKQPAEGVARIAMKAISNQP